VGHCFVSRDLEQTLSGLAPVSNPLPLGYSVYLSLDAVSEHAPLYGSLVNSYSWLDRAHEASSAAAAVLGQNSLNRTYGKMTKNRRRQQTALAVPQQPNQLEMIIQKVTNMYKDMSMSVSRPNGTKLNAVVEVGLGRVLVAVVVFKGLMIEWVGVRGPTEDAGGDIWFESRFEVFRRISHCANAAMLNFQSAMYPELSVKSYMTYLHSFATVFSDTCRACGRHLRSNLPPTWREFKTLEPYHEDCKP